MRRFDHACEGAASFAVADHRPAATMRGPAHSCWRRSSGSNGRPCPNRSGHVMAVPKVLGRPARARPSSSAARPGQRLRLREEGVRLTRVFRRKDTRTLLENVDRFSVSTPSPRVTPHAPAPGRSHPGSRRAPHAECTGGLPPIAPPLWKNVVTSGKRRFRSAGSSATARRRSDSPGRHVVDPPSSTPGIERPRRVERREGGRLGRPALRGAPPLHPQSDPVPRG